jgi:hypothetical protein
MCKVGGEIETITLWVYFSRLPLVQGLLLYILMFCHAAKARLSLYMWQMRRPHLLTLTMLPKIVCKHFNYKLYLCRQIMLECM